jgi:ABC-type transport system involved in multi-copper enzyme maturation permease subunit
MTLLPIVARELRVAARKRSTYLLRAGAVLWILSIGAWLFLMMQGNSRPHDISTALLGLLGGSAVLFCLMSGVRSTADCLCAEKREGTLGLLFLTDLKGYDVVLGKLAATSLNSVYGVVAVAPMLCIPLLMGGVSLAQVGRMALVAFDTLFFSLSLGIAVSAMSRSSRKAALMTFGFILMLTALLPALGAWLNYRGLPAAAEKYFYVASPGFSFGVALDPAFYKAASLEFWGSLIVIHGLGWAALLLACAVAPRAWQDRPAGQGRRRWQERWQRWSYGDAEERQAFQRALLNVNPYYWLAARDRLKPLLVRMVLGLLACGWVYGLVKLRREWLNPGVYIATALVLNALIKLWFGSEAGRQLALDREQGAFEWLLSTPLNVRDILRGQRLALQRQFLNPALLVLALFLVFMKATAPDTGMPASQWRSWFLFWSGGIVMFAADLAALYWVGMWQGLTAKRTTRVGSSTIARILVLPWLGMGLAVLVTTLTGRFEPGPNSYEAIWLAFGLGADLFFGSLARHKLLTDFRRAASQKSMPPLRHKGPPAALEPSPP